MFFYVVYFLVSHACLLLCLILKLFHSRFHSQYNRMFFIGFPVKPFVALKKESPGQLSGDVYHPADFHDALLSANENSQECDNLSMKSMFFYLVLFAVLVNFLNYC